MVHDILRWGGSDHAATAFRGAEGGGFGIGSGAPVPRDLVAILAVLFVTYVLHFFRSTAGVPALLQLSSAVYGGFVWQVVTYPFVGFPAADLVPARAAGAVLVRSRRVLAVGPARFWTGSW